MAGCVPWLRTRGWSVASSSASVCCTNVTPISLGPAFKDAKYKGKEIGTATIFLREWRISTNVMDKERHRAVGTRAMNEVQEQVLQNGLPWVQRAYVVDDWYITAYEPIRDFQDKIVGMLYVGILETKYAVLKEKLILLFMLGMLVSVAISSFLSLKMIKKEFWQTIKSDQKQ